MRAVIGWFVLLDLWLSGGPKAVCHQGLGASSQVRMHANVDPSKLPPGAMAKLGTSRFWHGSPISCLAISDDGKTVASAGEGGVVKLWNLETGDEIRRISVPGVRPRCLRFSGDGAYLMAVARGLLLIWRLSDPMQLRLAEKCDGNVDLMAFHRDGLHVIWGTTPSARAPEWTFHVMDLQSMKKVTFPARSDSGALSCAISLDGSSLALAQAQTADDEQRNNELTTITMIQTATGKKSERRVKLPARSRLALTDGQRLFFVSRNKVLILDSRTGRLLRQLTASGGIGCTFLSKNGLWVVTINTARGVEKPVEMWQAGDGKRIRELDTSTHGLFSGGTLPVAISPDCSILVSGVGSTLRICNLSTTQDQTRPSNEAVPVMAVHFGNNDKELYVASERSHTKWSTTNWGPAPTMPLPQRLEYFGLAFCISRSSFLKDGCVHPSALFLTNLAAKNTGRPAFVLSNGQVFLRPKDAYAYLINRAEKKEEPLELEISRVGRPTLTFALPGVNGLPCLDASGEVLAWPAQEEVRVVRLGGPTVMRSLSAPGETVTQLVCFSGKGNLLFAVHASARGLSLRMWNAETGEALGSAAIPEDSSSSEVRSMAVSPDHRTLALSFRDVRTVHLIELFSGKTRALLVGHLGPVTCLAFSQNGKMLASGSEDNTVLVWDLTRLWPSAPPHGGQTTIADNWTRLGSRDGRVAFRAMIDLSQSQREALSLVDERIRPARRLSEEEVLDLAAKLGDPRLEKRQAAVQKLEQGGESGAAKLRKARTLSQSLEARRRVDRVLESLERFPFSPHKLRLVRCIELLEGIGNEAAVGMLERLSSGDGDAFVTWEAKDSLSRLIDTAQKKRGR